MAAEATLETPTGIEPDQNQLSVPIGEIPIAGILERMGLPKEDAPPAEPETKPEPPPAKVPPKPPAPPAAPDAPPESLFEPPKPAEPAPVDDVFPEEPPESIKTEKAKADYRNFRKAYVKLQQENAQLKSAPKDAVPDAGVLAENEQLKGRLSEMSAVVERADLLSHPAIQQQVIIPRKQAQREAEQLLTEIGLEPKALERALNLTGKAKIDALDELNEQITSPTVRIELSEIARQLQRIDRDQEALLSDVKGTRERLDLEERANKHRQMQAQEKQLLSMVDMTVEELRDKAGFEFLKEVDGNDKWNAGVQKSIEHARWLLTKNTDPSQLAAAAVLAPMAVQYRSAYVAERQQRLALAKELAELKGAEPGLGGAGGSGKSAGDAIPENASMLDIVRTMMHKA